MKPLPAFCGVLAALLVIFFWPSHHKQIKAIHLSSGAIYSLPTSLKEASDQIEFDAIDPDGLHRHVHWKGSYWVEYLSTNP